jgi:cyclopropane-fatty-acyl-phospholipid synthase
MSKHVDTAEDSSRKALTIFRLLMRDYHPRDFAIRFWDGSQWPAETGSPRFTLILNHPHALRCMLQNGGSDLAISESYIRGDLDLEGDLEAAMPLATYLAGRHWPISTTLLMVEPTEMDRDRQRCPVTFIRSSEIGKR